MLLRVFLIIITATFLIQEKGERGKHTLSDNVSEEQFAMLYLYRPGAVVGMTTGFNVFVDDQKVWRCRNNSRAAVKLSKKGPTEIVCKNMLAKSSIWIDARFGDSYYVQVEYVYTGGAGMPKASQVGEVYGQQQYDMIKKKKK